MTNTLDNQSNTEPNNQFGRKVIINTVADQTAANSIGMFKVVGIDMNDNVLVETLAGGAANANVTTTNFFKSVESIQLIGGKSSAIKAGSAADVSVVLDGVMSNGGTAGVY